MFNFVQKVQFICGFLKVKNKLISNVSKNSLTYLEYFFSYLSAMEQNWDAFRCPLFLGCHVTVTGYNQQERKEIEKLVVKNGGKYSGSMHLNETTHLIALRPEGQLGFNS